MPLDKVKGAIRADQGASAVDALTDKINDFNLDEEEEDDKVRQEKEANTVKNIPTNGSSNKLDKENDSDDDDDEFGELTPKGPIRNRVAGDHHAAPYDRPNNFQQQQQRHEDHEDLDGHLGQFLDGMEPGLLAQEQPAGIPGLPGDSSPPQVMRHVDEMFSERATGSRIMLRNADGPGVTTLNLQLALGMDERSGRLGVNVPAVAIPARAVTQKMIMDGRTTIFVQLDTRTSRVIKLVAGVEQAKDGSHWGFR